MWWTEEGERVLRGAEWELFRAGLDQVWADVEAGFDDEDFWPSGIVAFDDLQPGQKLALLAQVGQALHDEAIPCPDLTAHVEATVAVVFEYIRHSVEFEIETNGEADKDGFYWRQLVRLACVETGIADEVPLPDAACDDVEEWAFLVECLAERILWDDDFVAGAAFLDGNPEVTRPQMEALGIADDYFVAVVPDPGPKELEAIRRTLQAITGRELHDR